MASDPNGGAGDGVDALRIDEAYEFCAPRYFDFMNEETEEDIRRAERWFETSLSYPPSRTFLADFSPFFSLICVSNAEKKRIFIHPHSPNSFGKNP